MKDYTYMTLVNSIVMVDIKKYREWLKNENQAALVIFDGRVKRDVKPFPGREIERCYVKETGVRYQTPIASLRVVNCDDFVFVCPIEFLTKVS